MTPFPCGSTPGATSTAAVDHGSSSCFALGCDASPFSSSTMAVTPGSSFPSAPFGTPAPVERGGSPVRIRTSRRKRTNTLEALAEMLLAFGARPDFVKCPPRSSSSDNSNSKNNSSPIHDNAEPGDIARQQVTASCGGGGMRRINKTVAGETPLHVAARESSVRVVEVLLRAGANPNAKTMREEGGMSPLHFAACPGGEDHRRAVVRLLLSAGADANAVSTDRMTTPLRRACENAAVGCVEELLRWDPHVSPVSSSILRVAGDLAPGNSTSSRPCSAVPAAASSLLLFGAAAPVSPSDAGSLSGSSQDPIAPSAAAAAAAAKHISSSHHTGHLPNLPAQRPPATTSEFMCLVKTLEGEVGSRVPAAAKDPADLKKIRVLLRRAPADRAWRRRGWLLMLYNRCSPNATINNSFWKNETVTFCRPALGRVSFAGCACRSAQKAVDQDKEVRGRKSAGHPH